MKTITNDQDFSQAVAEFAKANKINKAKLQTFVSDLMMQIKPVKTGGRPMAPSTLKLRDDVLNAVRNGANTTETIGTAVGNSNKVYISNALIYWEKEGMVKRIGKDTSKTGKGKKPIIWGLVEM